MSFDLARARSRNDAMAKLTGYLADFKSDFEFSNGRLLQLAEAIPADKYGWQQDVHRFAPRHAPGAVARRRFISPEGPPERSCRPCAPQPV